MHSVGLKADALKDFGFRLSLSGTCAPRITLLSRKTVKQARSEREPRKSKKDWSLAFPEVNPSSAGKAGGAPLRDAIRCILTRPQNLGSELSFVEPIAAHRPAKRLFGAITPFEDHRSDRAWIAGAWLNAPTLSRDRFSAYSCIEMNGPSV